MENGPKVTGPLTLSGQGAFTGGAVPYERMGPKSPLANAPMRGLRAALCLLLAGAASIAGAAHAAESAPLDARAVLVERLSVVKAQDLDFGTIIPVTGGTVVLVPTATATCTVTGAVIRSGACQAAEFVGAGSVNQRVRVRIPAGATMVVTNSAGNQMTITQMELNGAPDLLVVKENPRTFRLRVQHPSGIFYFRVGGTLNVGANQPVGTYSGTFDVDIQYF